MPFTPKFADLVRCATATTGTGNFVQGSAPSGFRNFTSAFATGDQFYYSCMGVDNPSEKEVGRGTMQSDGTIARDSTISGGLTSFSTGAKTLACVVAAEWLTSMQAGSGSGGVGLPDVQLFADIAAATVPAAVLRIRTVGRTTAGQGAGAYVRSTNTTALGAQASAIVAALPSGQQAAATTDLLAIMSRIRIQSYDGAWWHIDDSLSDAHGGHFGMISDASTNYAAGTVTGTDNWAAAQALIDYRTYVMAGTQHGSKDCLFPPGAFRFTKGLQLGYGDTFKTVRVKGAGRGIIGTTIFSDFDNQPMFSVHNGRYSGISGMTVVSPLGRAWLYNKNFGAINHTSFTSFSIDDRDITSWNDPSYPNRSALLRYNPHAGIAWDPYAGTAPSNPAAWATGTSIAGGEYRTANSKLYIARRAGTTAGSGTGPSATTDKIVDNTVIWAYIGPSTQAVKYPAATPPAFIASAYQITYGKSIGSSNMEITDVNFDGYPVSIMVQPAQSGQGDFLKCHNVDTMNTAIPCSVGGTQSRNNDFQRFNPVVFHTMIDGLTHGLQTGRTGGVFTDCSASAGIQLVNIGAQGAAGQLTFDGFYAEALWRLGTFSTSGFSGSALVFNGGHIEFGFHVTANGGRGVPLYLFGRDDAPLGAASENFVVVMNNIDIGSFEGMAVLRMVSTIFNNVSLTANDQASVTTQWRARSLNTTAGGLVFPRMESKNDQLIRYNAQNETSLGNLMATSSRRNNKLTSRDYPASIYTPSFSPAYGRAAESIINPVPVSTYGKSEFTTVSLSGRTLTMTAPSYMDTARANEDGFVPGGVIWDDNQGFVFIIQTRTGSSGSYVFTCQLQNGYWYNNAGAIQYEQSFSTTAGNYYCSGGGLFTPGYPLFGTTAVSSATMSGIQRGDTGGAGINTSTGAGGSLIQVGDILYRDRFADRGYNGQPGNAVTSVGSGTLNAGDYFQRAGEYRFPVWQRGS